MTSTTYTIDLPPPFTPPDWLVRSDYDAVKYEPGGWMLCRQFALSVLNGSMPVKYEPGGWMLCRSGLPSIPANIHHDLRDMLTKIDPKVTPVAWERNK